MNDAPESESARAVLLTPRGSLLLLKVRDEARELWITPGGRRRASESPRAAVARELREETGIEVDAQVAPELWIRRGAFRRAGVEHLETERFFLLRAASEFVPTAEGMENDERARFVEFRWWTPAEIAASSASFVPRELASLLARVIAEGPPAAPLVLDER